MNKPNLFIVGAMKSATTSLYNYMSQHKDIYMSLEKEPLYFIDGFPHNKSGDLMKRPHKGLREFPESIRKGDFTTEAKYLKLFEPGGGKKYRGEGSTLYLPHQPAAGQIARYSPDAKIIAVLRNPIERAYSAYTFQKSFGLEPASSFREAIDEEIRGERDDWWYGWRHLYTSMYSKQVSEFYKHFPHENIYLINQTEMRNSMAKVMSGVFRFLEVDENISIDVSHQSNVTRYRSDIVTSLYRDLYAQNYIKDKVKYLIPIKVRKPIAQALRNFIESLGERPQAMSEKDRSFLQTYYRDELNALESVTGWDLSSWK